MSFGIDHPLLAVNDLQRATDMARALGFSVTPRHRHPWGTDNHLLLFSNNFIELTGIARPECLDYQDDNGFQFGRLIEGRLSRLGDGIALVALDSDSIQRDHALAAARGFAENRPIVFRRLARRPDQGEEEVSVALDIFHDAERPFLTQFLCQQLRPALFRIDPTQESHANTATSIADIWYVSDDPGYDANHFRKIHGDRAVRRDGDGWTVHTLKGDCHLLNADTLAARFPVLEGVEAEPPRAVALTLTCRDLDAAVAHWKTHEIPYVRLSEHQADIPPGAIGPLLRFEQR
ncbi:VOC family protein [Salinicola aestuarinus]|uniref:VOC family protein n=1 Tax=Salinicola aestuarinus TaxID=1949082 RepID=UPI000DA22E42|nr:VOC family protein [Salinicola aestuarinus]